jgi:hypothetical protein
LGALAVATPVAVIVSVIADRPDEPVKKARLEGSVKVAVEEFVNWRGGNVTVSVPEPKTPAGMG